MDKTNTELEYLDSKERGCEKQMVVRKRVEVVSIQMVRDSSFLYDPRYIKSPEDGVKMAKQFLDGKDREEFLVVTLDTKNQPTSINVCSRGTLNASIVHPRDVFKSAILSNSASILLFHNHPSGIPKPSVEDIRLTKRLKNCGDIMGIKVMDHIIIGEDSHYSFKEHDEL